jgi:hypothetical protein
MAAIGGSGCAILLEGVGADTCNEADMAALSHLLHKHTRGHVGSGVTQVSCTIATTRLITRRYGKCLQPLVIILACDNVVAVHLLMSKLSILSSLRHIHA